MRIVTPLLHHSHSCRRLRPKATLGNFVLLHNQLVFVPLDEVSSLLPAMAPDLFSFLDHAPPEDESDNETLADKISISPSVPVSTSSQKRKSSPGDADPVGRLPPAPRETAERPVKRSRAASPVPVVVDEFQTEAKREMAASGGLTGPAEEGSRLELRHQVCGATRCYRPSLCYSGPASSRHSSRLRLCSHRKAYSSLKTRSGI